MLRTQLSVVLCAFRKFFRAVDEAMHLAILLTNAGHSCCDSRS